MSITDVLRGYRAGRRKVWSVATPRNESCQIKVKRSAILLRREHEDCLATVEGECASAGAPARFSMLVVDAVVGAANSLAVSFWTPTHARAADDAKAHRDVR